MSQFKLEERALLLAREMHHPIRKIIESENIGRREAITILATLVATGGCVSAPTNGKEAAMVRTEATVNPTNTLRKNQTLYPKGSECAPVVDDEWRQDFYGHLRREPHKVGVAGVDLKADASTIILAADDGYVTKIDEHKIVIFNGLGFRTQYGHIDQILVSLHQYVRQGQPIGKGGTTAVGKYNHGHLTLFGPEYAPFFKGFREGVNLQSWKNVVVSWKYVLDPELFSAFADCLPYFRKDVNRGVPLIDRVKLVQKEVYGMLDQLRKQDLSGSEKSELEGLLKGDKFSQSYLDRTQIDVYLDRKMAFLYRQLNKTNPPFSNPGTILHKLVDLMANYVPALTASIAK